MLHTQLADVLASSKQEEDVDDGMFEGDSSFRAQSNEVARTFDNASPSSSNQASADRSSGTKRTPDGQSPSLKSSASTQAVVDNYPKLAKLPLPPSQDVLTVLRLARSQCLKIRVET